MQARFGPIEVEIDNHWDRAVADVDPVFDLYPHGSGEPDLSIRIQPWDPDYSSADPDVTARYGWFYNARWDFSGIPRVTLSTNRSPLRLVRPLVDFEMHRLHEDVARIIHERILTTYVQATRARDCTFVHGAAMVTPSGSGVLIGGLGGVGKTSLALETGRGLAWRFLSDDLTLVSRQGEMFLNANRPKIYAYNVVGDSELEAVVLDDRSLLNRIHWAVKKPWPNRVRRSVLPTTLYKIGDVAPLSHMLLVERADVSDISAEQISRDAIATRSVEILIDELRRVREYAQALVDSDQFRESELPNTWEPDVWRQTLHSSLENTNTVRLLVPMTMTALEYRTKMRTVLPSIVGT